MLHAHWQSRLDRSRFHGSLNVGGERWDVYFVEVQRTDRDWVVDCVVIGARSLHVTIRCHAEGNHYHTAHRVMSALRAWLEQGDACDAAYLEVPRTLERAS